MVRQDTSYSYKIIKSPSFGISYDLLKSLDDNPEIHSLNNKNINSFTESFHSLKTYYDHLTIICKTQSERNDFDLEYKKKLKGLPPTKYPRNSYQRALVHAFSKSTIQNKVIMKDELESNKDRINFLFAEKDIEYNDFSSIQNIPHLSSDQIIGDTAEGQEGKNGFNSLFIATPITASFESGLPKKYNLKTFFRYLKFRSDFLTIYDPYMFLTRGKYLQYDKKRKKEVNKKMQFIFGHNEYDRNIDKLKINEKEAEKLALRLTFWLKWMNSNNINETESINDENSALESEIKHISILSKAPAGINSELIEKQKDNFFNYMESVIKSTNLEIKDFNNEKLNFLSIKKSFLELSEQLKDFKERITEIFSNANQVKGLNVDIKLDILEEFKDFFENLNDSEELDFKELILEYNNYQDSLTKASSDIRDYKIINESLEKSLENSSESFDDQINFGRLESIENHFIECIKSRDLQIEKIIMQLDTVTEYACNKITEVEEKIESISQEIKYRNIKCESLSLLLKNKDDIIMIEHNVKKDWEKKSKNLHDRVYFNDHTMVSWGKGFDIIDDVDDFDRTKAQVKLNSSLTVWSVFDERRRTKFSSSKETTSYALFDKIAKDILLVIDDAKKN